MAFKLTPHPDRAAALAELHARPFELISTPRAVLHLTFMGQSSDKQRAENFTNWCREQNVETSEIGAKHHALDFKDYRLSWENHLEFVSFTWDCPYGEDAGQKLYELACTQLEKILDKDAKLICAVQLSITKHQDNAPLDLTNFNQQSLSMSKVRDDRAILISDFMPDEHGGTHFYIQNKALDLHPMGALERRLLEIETYRMLALLGFSEAKRISPKITEIENKIIQLTQQVGSENGMDNDAETNRKLLDQLTQMGNDLEALSASCQYRLSATKAYYNIVLSRLEELKLQPIQGFVDIQTFLTRRLAPAMATCTNLDERIAIASKKLSRSANLLRTRVDIQLEAQNLSLLNSMNKRAKMQYRLQTTVEGLSIAAVSYYVLGLLSYLFKGLDGTLPISTKLMTAIAVPFVIMGVWFVVRQIRKSHHD